MLTTRPTPKQSYMIYGSMTMDTSVSFPSQEKDLYFISVLGSLQSFMKKKVVIKSICMNDDKLDPVGSTVRYEMMKLCTGSV